MARAFVLLLLGACAPGTPLLATDTVWLEPGVAGEASGFLTRALYDGQPLRERNFVCAQVFVVELAPASTACDGCDLAWDVTAWEPVDGDCGEVAQPPDLRLTGLAAGVAPSEIVGERPWPLVSSGGRARYADPAWIEHGWVVPDGSSGPVEAPGWDGATATTWWPAWALTL